MWQVNNSTHVETQVETRQNSVVGSQTCFTFNADFGEEWTCFITSNVTHGKQCAITLNIHSQFFIINNKKSDTASQERLLQPDLNHNHTSDPLTVHASLLTPRVSPLSVIDVISI